MSIQFQYGALNIVNSISYVSISILKYIFGDLI